MSRSASRGRLFSALGELTWYLSGSADPEHISYYLPKYSENVGDFSGSYGPRLFGPGRGAQVAGVIDQLRASPTTRKAVVQLFDRSDLLGNAKDVPCTCTLQFFVRDSKVELVVYMRSNDVMFGLLHDVFSFTFLQELIASTLSLEIGTYKHVVGSLHLYSDQEDEARAFLKEGAFMDTPMPAMPKTDPWAMVAWILSLERSLRASGSAPIDEHAPDYWNQLALVLRSWSAYKTQDLQMLKSLQIQLEGSPYAASVRDRMHILEAQRGSK
ncbi:thymidylate synthase [Clavibacter sp. VKM Ac-2872]|uniref:thymidylate synthase n=1 Tax=Clavibacter sp. VKM Ac-2872 TaxID=2783812 RepID=UPI00188CDBB6|nr:thymidylate synthase [Clavibacter sp. VKM Ac-2872]MBF4624984.1 thymidylate synthase [Clavibacter sp. VKM Ac-2872]